MPATVLPDYSSVASHTFEIDEQAGDVVPPLVPNRHRSSTSSSGGSPSSPTHTRSPFIWPRAAQSPQVTPASASWNVVEPFDLKYDPYGGDQAPQYGSPPSVGPGPRTSRSDSLHPSVSAPSFDPPSYGDARYPTTAVTYTFSQASSNSMLLIPPESSPDTRPLYHISVSMNCFCPDSYVTIIRKGATAEDPIVGEFEMGGPNFKETVSVRGNQFPLRTILTRQDEAPGSSFQWNMHDKKHVWFPGAFPPNFKPVRKYDGAKLPVPYVCTTKDKTKLYAKFYPATDLKEHNKICVSDRLYVEPVVYKEKMMDEIVLSCLVTERWRWLMAMGKGHAVLGRKEGFSFKLDSGSRKSGAKDAIEESGLLGWSDHHQSSSSY